MECRIAYNNYTKRVFAHLPMLTKIRKRKFWNKWSKCSTKYYTDIASIKYTFANDLQDLYWLLSGFTQFRIAVMHAGKL